MAEPTKLNRGGYRFLHPRNSRALINLYQSLDWVGQNIDQLVLHHSQPVSELTSSLMELELLGLCMQQSGLYLRCRS